MKKNATPTKRQLQFQQTEEKLFRSSITLFSQHGYQNVTVDDIVNDAGSSKGSFYNCFRTKYDVIKMQFLKVDEYLDAHFQIDSAQSARENLMVLLTMLYRFIENDIGLEVTRTLYQIELGAEDLSVLLKTNRSMGNLILQIIALGRINGEIHSPLSDAQMILYLSEMVRSVIFEWILHNGHSEILEDGIRIFEDIYWKACCG